MIKFLILMISKLDRRILRISRNALFLSLVHFVFLGVGYPKPEKVQLTYDHYHSYNEMVEILQKLEKTYPQLIKVRSIGKSFEGRNLMMAEVTNYRTGSGDKKTGFYIDGNMHAGEVTGAETALHTLWCLVTRYGSDKTVTDLLDHLVFYIHPKVNPDGSEFYLLNAEWIRGNIRPFDDDRDGRVDEDPANDLDKDGEITQMRVPDPIGDWKIDSKDLRNMVKREPWERKGQFFKIYSEGFDDDNDGQINSYEKLRWNDEVLDRKGFIEWTPFNHPQLGWVEIGGWREKFVRQNPPPGPLLKEICDQHYRWTTYIARLLPRLEIVRLESNKLSEKLFKITGVVRNVGYLPTNVTHQALIAHVVEPVLAKLKLPKGAKILMGKEETNLGQIAGNFVDRIVEWLILSPSSGEVCLDVISTRAGTPVRKIRLR